MTKLKNILDSIPAETASSEKASLSDERRLAISGKNIRTVVLGAAGGKTIPARYDPDTRVFYPLFRDM